MYNAISWHGDQGFSVCLRDLLGISRLCLMDPIDPFGILIVGTHHAVRAARGLDFRQTRTDAGTIQRGQGKFSDSLHVVHSGIS